MNRPQRLPLPAKTRKTVAFNQQYLCAGCGCLLPPEHEIDHIVPVALNGSDALSNLQALCKPCHQQKTRDQRHTILDAVKKEPPVVEEKEVKRVPPLKLNDQQRAAVEASTEPIRVVAGPGTGKTRVLTRRVAHLVESGARASSVLALTFTNRAANELRERLEEEINPQDASSISVGTFHRVCLTMLRDDVEFLESPIRRGFAVYDQAAMIKLCMLRRGYCTLRHRRASSPGKTAVGGLSFDFELFRTASRRVGENAVASMASSRPRCRDGVNATSRHRDAVDVSLRVS